MRIGARRLTIATSLLAASVAGCASDEESSSPTNEEQVAEVIAKMEAAFARQDGEEACSYMTEEGQQIYVKLATRFTGSQVETCEQAVAALVVSPSEVPDDVPVVTEGSPESEIVTPDDVTVDEAAGTARAANEFRGAMQLERVNGEWRVSVPVFID